MAMITKITTRKIGAVPSKDEPSELFQVVGIATGIQAGESQFGEWKAFIGTFKAVNLQTGEVFTSGKLFLPSVASNYLAGFLGGSDSVEFALQVNSIPSDNVIGYEYTVEPLIDFAEPKALAELSKRAGIKALQGSNVKESKNVTAHLTAADID